MYFSVTYDKFTININGKVNIYLIIGVSNKNKMQNPSIKQLQIVHLQDMAAESWEASVSQHKQGRDFNLFWWMNLAKLPWKGKASCF